MKIEAVTVSVGYADFLRETAPRNKHLFDRWVIVTDPADQDTFKVTRDLSLPCLFTEDHCRGGPFNKGRAIQRGFNSLSLSDWVIQMDADVVLPDDFREMLAAAHLREQKIYGCDREMVVGWEKWQKLKHCGFRQHGYHCNVKPHPDLKIGSRWVSPSDGYVPIGFFQLFHGSEIQKWGIFQKPYPAHHASASRADVQFALQWDRRHRELLGEFTAWHLESEHAPLGANWDGRTTIPFGPLVPIKPPPPYWPPS